LLLPLKEWPISEVRKTRAARRPMGCNGTFARKLNDMPRLLV
jgi:hypothetical protein